MDEKVKIRCPACTRIFRERAGKVRDGAQINCQTCNKLITLNRDTEDPFIRRALKSAKEMRISQEAEVFAAAYGSSRERSGSK
jgi:transposase-like protein